MCEKQEGTRKTLQELTISSSFMFAAVMMDEENAKAVLERAIGVKIRSVKVYTEKTLVYNPEYKGVRLDVEIEDEKHTHYDVEMQVANREIFKRSRYYHDQMDMELLLAGKNYEELPDTYVIFICDFDPVGLKKYRYTKKQVYAEAEDVPYEDGSHTIFLSTKGTNDSEVPKELVMFLKYVGANLEESRKDYGDELVRHLQESVEKVKRDREMGRLFMMEIYQRDFFKAGKDAGIIEGKLEGQIHSIVNLLNKLAPVSENLKERISSVTDETVLDELLWKAARTESISEFEKVLDEMHL